MLAVSLALLAALGWGAGGVLIRLGLQHLRPASATMASLIVGAIVTMVVAVAWKPSEIAALTWTAIGWIALLAVCNFLLGRLLNFTAMSLAGVSVASAVGGTVPLFATILAVAFLGESVTPLMALGTVSIVGGLGLILSRR